MVLGDLITSTHILCVETWQVNLSDNGIGPEGAKPLADALRVSASLTSVSLLRNGFDTEAAAMLLKVKEDHPKLKTLCGFSQRGEGTRSEWL